MLPQRPALNTQAAQVYLFLGPPSSLPPTPNLLLCLRSAANAPESGRQRPPQPDEAATKPRPVFVKRITCHFRAPSPVRVLSFHFPEVGGSTQRWGQRRRLWSPRDPGCSLVPQLPAVRSWACHFPSLTLHLSDQGPGCDNTIHLGQKRFLSHVKRSYLPSTRPGAGWWGQCWPQSSGPCPPGARGLGGSTPAEK